MEPQSLAGRSILIVEDESLIRIDIIRAFEDAGAMTTSTGTIKHALVLVEHDGLSGAVLDHGLPDGDSCDLCIRLTEREVPFIVHSGYRVEELPGPCKNAPYLTKPVHPEVIVATMTKLLEA